MFKASKVPPPQKKKESLYDMRRDQWQSLGEKCDVQPRLSQSDYPSLSHYCWWFRNPANHNLQGFVHLRWYRSFNKANITQNSWNFLYLFNTNLLYHQDTSHHNEPNSLHAPQKQENTNVTFGWTNNMSVLRSGKFRNSPTQIVQTICLGESVVSIGDTVTTF